MDGLEGPWQRTNETVYMLGWWRGLSRGQSLGLCGRTPSRRCWLGSREGTQTRTGTRPHTPFAWIPLPEASSTYVPSQQSVDWGKRPRATVSLSQDQNVLVPCEPPQALLPACSPISGEWAHCGLACREAGGWQEGRDNSKCLRVGAR